jgi:flagellar biosynthesis/type III secretory pathway protein FliH
MDENFTPNAWSRPEWVPLTRVLTPASAAPSRPRPRGATSFLQRDFSEDASPKPVAPQFSPAELAAIKQEGFEAGYATGLAEAAASEAAERTSSEVHALGIIADAMANGCEQAAAVADQAAGALARTLVTSLDAVMPDLIQRSALNEVDAMLAHVLAGLSREPAVRIGVPRAIADYVAATLASLGPEHRAKITVVGEDHMAPGEVRVDWGAGRAWRQPAEVWQAVMNVLNPALGEPDSKDSHHGE